MGRLRIFKARVLGMFRRSSLERDLDDELRTHLEMLVEENIRRGMSPVEARNAARRSFGGVDQTVEACRDQRGFMFFDSLLRDIRYGGRMLRKNPGFSAVVMLTLALGVGANTAIFSVLDAVMIETLPVHNPSQLLMLRWRAKGFPSVISDLEGNSISDPDVGGITSESFSYEMFQAARSQNTVFSDVFAFGSNITGFNVQFSGKAESALGEPVSGDYFSGLGAWTVRGRPILPEDDAVTAPPVAVISYAFWSARLGAADSVIGSTIVTNNISLTIVGVAPPEFFGTQPGERVDFWLPLHVFPRLLKSVILTGPAQYGSDADKAANDYWEDPTTWWLVVMGRMKPGVTEQQARAEMAVTFDQNLKPPADSERKEENRPALTTAPGSKGMDQLRRRFSNPLLVLMISVGLVLLIACANVAALLLARATARQKEIAVRLSLGARRRRLIQQLLTESVLLSLAGAALGLLLASWFSELLVALVGSGRQSIVLPLHISWRVLAFTAVVAVLTGLLFGLAPAFSATRMSLTAMLKEGGASNRLIGRRSKLAKALVSVQVALCLILLIGAGLFLRTLQKLEGIPLGFERQNLLMFSVAPALNGYEGNRLAEYYRQVRERIETIPGVRSVTFSAHGPVGSGESNSTVTIPGVTSGDQVVEVHRHLVAPGYFDTLGIPALAGRELTERDDAAGPKVAVINQALVRKAFGDTNPLGKVLRFGSAARPRDFEIVGVVGDAKYNRLREAPPPTAYFSYLQALGAASFMTFQVRTSGDPGVVAAALRGKVAEVDKNIPIDRLETLAQAIDKALLFERMFSRLTGFFGVLALVLVCVGLYGTMSYSVARRTNDIGVRMALGARPAHVFRMVLNEGLALTLSGVALGLAAAAAATRLIASELYDVPAIDPLTFGCVAVLLVGVALLACYLPARRAMNVDPIVALRYE
jgi:predicted permease